VKTVSRKIFVWLLATVLLTTAPPANAQQPTKIPRIGILPPGPISERVHLWESFRQGLRELGYVEGRNITLVFPSDEIKTEKLPHLAAELVSLKPDIIVAPTTPAAQAAMKATRTIPIVMPTTIDPVGNGLVSSLARPGGNATGLTSIASDLGGKRLELLKEVVPGASHIAVLSNPSSASVPPQMRETKVAAQALGVRLQLLEVRGIDDFEKVFRAATKERASALIMLDDAFVFTHRTRIVKLAATARLPAIYGFTESVEAGGLMSYAANLSDMYRRAATYVDKILKGAKPADLPVEQPTKFEFVINLKAAKQIGLTIPPNVLARADKVIK
jgi:putative tryptophan/tyrosine transport system substrate-binding protein